MRGIYQLLFSLATIQFQYQKLFCDIYRNISLTHTVQDFSIFYIAIHSGLVRTLKVNKYLFLAIYFRTSLVTALVKHYLFDPVYKITCRAQFSTKRLWIFVPKFIGPNYDMIFFFEIVLYNSFCNIISYFCTILLSSVIGNKKKKIKHWNVFNIKHNKRLKSFIKEKIIIQDIEIQESYFANNVFQENKILKTEIFWKEFFTFQTYEYLKNRYIILQNSHAETSKSVILSRFLNSSKIFFPINKFPCFILP